MRVEEYRTRCLLLLLLVLYCCWWGCVLCYAPVLQIMPSASHVQYVR